MQEKKKKKASSRASSQKRWTYLRCPVGTVGPFALSKRTSRNARVLATPDGIKTRTDPACEPVSGKGPPIKREKLQLNWFHPSPRDDQVQFLTIRLS